MTKELIVQMIQNVIQSEKQIMKGIRENILDEHVKFLNFKYPETDLIEQCYLLYHDKEKKDFLCNCGKMRTFHTWKRGYNLRCSSSHFKPYIGKKKINYPKNRAPRINTVLISKVCITCGKEFTTKLPERIACSKSCGAKYNRLIETPEKKALIQAKREVTSLQKYGDRHHINSEHCRKKTEEKLGVKYPWQSKEILEGIRDRCELKYGVRSHMQRPEIREKMMATKLEKYGDFLKPLYNYKTYTFPSGKTAKVQGYEPKMLDQLLSEGYSEADIVVGRGKIQQHTGHFKYFSEKTGRMHFYYPDIYVVSENRVIEVKSKFTAKMHEDTLLLKQKSVEEKGLRFDLRIF
jgi:hypothetical protein